MTLSGLVQRYRRWKLAERGVVVDRSCYVHPLVSVGDQPRVHPRNAIQIDPECELGRGVELNPWGGRIHLGRQVFLGPYVVIYGHGGVEISDHCLIAMHCCILSSNHTIPPRSEIVRHKPDIFLPTKIGRDCWLGAAVTVLGGVQIGDGCVIGAGAVVTKDMPPYSIANGVPARVVGQRK
jgi:acetyltransferase-like isoleucine patch superfamily enzyme